ncbi:acetylornithine transaminase [Herbiconiux sp. L3-i23]|uniref:acetylornithine transaminase n=1 Tax=Herbiconiux sp. L3-i23 TaxID=2905871 RepID=UPI0020604AAE|nr:acetylornithine transaminase [Herbiconiux sp. L3-i23]BDI22247.1 acetylornithine aminotransferase [Herbiconiux sp. L3-i23]
MSAAQQESPHPSASSVTGSSPTGSSAAELTARHGSALMRTLGTPLLVLERGQGSWVWDIEGNRYLDFLAGIAVNSLGHAHPVIVEAAARQAATLVHVSNYFATPPQIELAERLRRITGAGDEGRAYFGNSGAEAIEAAFKLARRNGGPGKNRILSLKNAFHGRTMGALALTGKPALQEHFGPMVPGVEHIDSTIEALEAAIDETVSALVLEPIKGEAGVLPLPEGYLARARELTAKHDALLIIDEIQTGVGRTGKWFAYQHEGIVPDAVAIAKGIAGGIPIGALVTFGRASELLKRGDHGSTFGGNPFATAVANAVLEEIEQSQLIDNARVRGRQVRAIIEDVDSPAITAVRGKGLMVGVGIADGNAAEVASAALAQGLIINAPNPDNLRIVPPLTIGDDEIAEFETRFRAALASL